MPTQGHKTILTASGICKSFGSNEVLHDVEVELKAGEVHALLGENGAGKSTLVKIISGYEQPTKGTLTLDGGSVIWNDTEAEDNGVILIHQEFNLAAQLTVEESIFLGREIKKGMFLDKAQMQKLSHDYLLALNTDINPRTQIKDLSVADKQMVEIAKATSRNARVLILDEPTAVLTGKEAEILFELIRKLQAQGVAIVYISHKLDEIEAIADVITILRDGKMVGKFNQSEVSKDDMARLMVGRDLSGMFPPKTPIRDNAPIAFEVKNYRVNSQSLADFDLKQGEILGFSGLVGSGRTALIESIIGLAPRGTGEVELYGKPVTYKNISQARDDGIAYLTKDRKEKGLLLNMALQPNFSLFALEKFSNGLIDSAAEKAAFEEGIKTFDLRTGDMSVMAGSLSGGNQQKLLLAKTMEAEPRVIIIDEPTRGIDVGTKAQIYAFIQKLAAAGNSIIVISSEMIEVIGLSHRVAVMHNGVISGVLRGDQLEEHEIMRYATGLKGNLVDA